MKPPRKRVQALAQGRGGAARIVIPLAFDVAARISARSPAEFRCDPTQLTNALGELQQAIAADGVVCALAGGMERESAGGGALDALAIASAGPVAASLEACRRLRATHGDALALAAGLSGPATLARAFAASTLEAGAAFAALVKAFCAAGADVLFVCEETGAAGAIEDTHADALRTAANIARFHQALLLGLAPGPLPCAHAVPLAAPAANGTGIVTTAGAVPADADIAALARWVAVTRGPPG